MATAPETPTAMGDELAQRPKGRPPWILIGFVAAIAVVYAGTQFRTQSGPPVVWQSGDLSRVLEQARREHKRVFLYLYDPANPMAERNEREVFTQRWARDVLALVLCVRMPIDQQNLADLKIAQRYGYKDEPMMVVLDPNGQKVAPPIQGVIDERQFYTYIDIPARRPVADGKEKGP